LYLIVGDIRYGINGETGQAVNPCADQPRDQQENDEFIPYGKLNDCFDHVLLNSDLKKNNGIHSASKAEG
jgi:hypothetical protein